MFQAHGAGRLARVKDVIPAGVRGQKGRSVRVCSQGAQLPDLRILGDSSHPREMAEGGGQRLSH